jgi:ankyrin repeat protein
MKRLILTMSLMIAAAAVYLGQAQEGELASLIQAGNRQAALEMIQSGADVNEAQPDGTRPIHWAVYRVDYELIEQLIGRNASVDVINQLGSTPLAEAVKVQDARIVQMLLDAGADADSANHEGQTALMLAIRSGDVAILETLMAAGANVNAVEQVQDQTPLMWAAAAGDNAAEMVALLIESGADVNARARFTDWPSQITSEPRWQYHAYGGLTALLYAARGGCGRCVEALIEGGADIDLPTPEGATALMVALDNQHYDVGALLLDLGANPHAWDVYGRTALYIAVDQKNRGGGGGGFGGRGGRGGDLPLDVPDGPQGPEVTSMDIITALLDAGVDPNTQLSQRRPSNQGGRFSDANLSTGVTPLFRAVMDNDMEVIEALVEHGANPNVVGMGATPFLLAAGVNPFGGRGGGGGPANTELLDLLIENGADVDAQVNGTLTFSMRIARSMSDDEGISALHFAVESGNTAMVRYLLDHGARTDIRDWTGRTPVDVANGAPRRPIPQELAEARVPNPYGAPEVAEDVDAINIAGGRGGPTGPDQAIMAEILALLEGAARNN